MARNAHNILVSNPYVCIKLNEMKIFKNIELDSNVGGNLNTVPKIVDKMNKKYNNVIDIIREKNKIKLNLKSDLDYNVYCRKGGKPL
jgi:hypothetical protein